MSKILLVGFIIATVAVLVIGIITMMRGGDSKENKKFQNRLMQYRIYFQAAAIAVLVIVFSIAK